MNEVFDRKATVRAIFIGPSAGEPMVELKEARVVAGRGLVGDRYMLGRGFYSGRGTPKIRELSLIDADAIDAANADALLPFDWMDTRRNIVTRGVKLNELIDVEFVIGDVVVRGTELCKPCNRPSQLSDTPGFKEAFEDRGGLRVAVLESGVIRLNDPIRPAPAV